TRFSRDWSSDVCSSDLEEDQLILCGPALCLVTRLCSRSRGRMAAPPLGLATSRGSSQHLCAPTTSVTCTTCSTTGQRKALNLKRSEERRVGNRGRTKRW